MLASAPLWLAITAVSFVLWLLPACAVAPWLISRRNVRRGPAAVGLGLLTAAFACGTLFLFWALFDWPPSRTIVLREIPTQLKCALFVVTWFVAYESLSLRALRAAPDVGPAQRPIASMARRAGRTAVETLVLVAVAAWTAILGLIGGGFTDLVGDVEYRLDSAVASPKSGTRACLVDYFTGGGALGDWYKQVYLVRASEAWSPKRRGLLIWTSHDFEVVRVEWDSGRSLRVVVRGNTGVSPSGGAQAYSRDGFTAHTVVVPGP